MPTSCFTNWPSWTPAVISVLSAILIALMIYKSQKQINDRKNKQEHLLTDKKHLKDILGILIDNIDVVNPINSNIGSIWQIQEKIHFFSDQSNPHIKNLITSLEKFTSSYERMKIAVNPPQIPNYLIIDAKKDFNAKNKELIQTVNKYFDYYLTGK